MIKNKIKIKYLINLNSQKFNFDTVFIQHYLCPGFDENYNGSLKNKWNKLVFYSKHIPAKFTKIMLQKRVKEKVNPYINSKAKVIYYYRNPLDQAVAYFKTIQTHLDEDLKYYYDFQLKKKKIFTDVHDFLRKAGIDMYIKHYLSFELTQKIYPNNKPNFNDPGWMKRINKSFFLSKYFLSNIEMKGDVLECGVFKGFSSLLLITLSSIILS